jgi:hypothetical protein
MNEVMSFERTVTPFQRARTDALRVTVHERPQPGQATSITTVELWSVTRLARPMHAHTPQGKGRCLIVLGVKTAGFSLSNQLDAHTRHIPLAI